ncbi:hypothetical protein F8S13_16460 [Chloroflexia bacterium SDU3-3]|nr:hypothetical protein F8S13_16460 [Chloroflexia bacterium SDU3-3]
MSERRTKHDTLDSFQRTYRSLLRSSGEIQIEAMVEPYLMAEPVLHEGARSAAPDAAALIYSSLRLPACMGQVRLLLFGQSHEVFAQHGFGDVQSWQQVTAPGRRRKMYFDGEQTLAVLIASPSDIDDIIPMVLAYQIEWNKIYRLLQDPALARQLQGAESAQAEAEALAALGLAPEDQARLRSIWGARLGAHLLAMGERRKRLAVRMLGGALMDYQRATLRWWWHVEDSTPLAMRDRPIYFVSSNTHALVNLLSGFALRHTDELLGFIQGQRHASLMEEYEKIQAMQVPSSRENFFYYVQKKYQADTASQGYFAQRARDEQGCGIHRIASEFYLDVDVQIMELGKLRPDWLDPRLRVEGIERLAESDALIVNIDYPLGMAAYQILTIVARSVGSIRGVYVLGKAATLNGKIGDVLIPNVVFDDHTDNTYHFAPCFSAADVEPYLTYGAVLDNQKAATVRGTFLQNRTFLDALYGEFLTDLEMEAGPYLSAIYEQSEPDRTPHRQNISFFRPAYEFGFLHYASDTPASKGRNLGSQNLSYFGMDPTYATALAAARRILTQEIERLHRGR